MLLFKSRARIDTYGGKSDWNWEWKAEIDGIKSTSVLQAGCTDWLHLQRRRLPESAGQVTIQSVCMSGVVLRWNDLCHVCRTTSSWWPHHAQPKATPCLAACIQKIWLWHFSFSDFPFPVLGSECIQSELLNPGLWTIRHHLIPSMTNISAALSHTLCAPSWGQGQMSRGLYSLRFCR